ncbi:MAG: NAD-dependent deacylase [Deltaproteobacteria bacterium]|nr:NAD-dependent deacylase [Deltaproteobacteria bacterium]MDQ3298234.1 NAD-dependent deacylase [Myxococcota bacterium]
MIPLSLDGAAHLLVLTGAGISAESGVPTFRDAGGLWEGHAVEQVASPDGFAIDPSLVWRFYSQRRAGLTGVTPNLAHHALVEAEARLGERFLLVTQNVDGLHPLAGSRRMLEMHGNIMRTRCSACDRAPFEDRTAYGDGVVPLCDRCSAPLRPDIVWFGEMIARATLAAIDAFVRAAGSHLVFLAVGTSGVVYPAAGLVDVARAAGGRSFLVNAEPPANAARFDHIVIGPAGRALPALLGA